MRSSDPLDRLKLIGARPRAARIVDFFSRVDESAILRGSSPARSRDRPERPVCPVVSFAAVLDDPFQGRVGDQAAIPIVLAIDLDGGKAGRQRSARHDVLGPDRVGVAVEIDEIARPDVDRARAKARYARHSGDQSPPGAPACA